MSIASSILEAVQVSRQAAADMLEFYYSEGVISLKDLETYTDYLIRVNEELEYRLSTIFGVCESRLQVKKEKNE